GQVHWLEAGQDLDWLAAQLTYDTCLWLQDYTIDTVLRWEADGLINGPVASIDQEHALAGLEHILADKAYLAQVAA
ncbi:MAG: hypothetical protein D6790_16625, partial [Caldilineae bacterium]